MAAEADVSAMAQQIARVVGREGWQADRGVVPDMQKLLGRLTTLRVDLDLLQRTKIGAMVSKLKKHEDEVVRGYSTTLTKRWKEQVGVPTSSGASGSSSVSSRPPARRPAPSPSPPKPAADTARLESARKRLKESYASEKATRESRTVQVLTSRPVKGKRGTTISAAPSRSSISRFQQVRAPVSSALSHRSVLASASRSAPPSTARRLPPPARKDSLPRRVVPPASSRVKGRPLTRDELHEERIRKLKALSNRTGGSASDSSPATRAPPSRADSRPRPASSSRPPSAQPRNDTRPSSARSTSSMDLPDADADRRAMLAKMFPRVHGVASSANAASGSAGKSSGKKAPATPSGASGRPTKRSKPVSYTESQREVIEWLRGLSVDMSEYAAAFFENGFDSIKLLSTIEKEDLPGLVPKKGHHRLIQQALSDLRLKHSTAASGRPRPAGRERGRQPARRRHDPFDEDSDDSFVVDDSDEYSPGVITAMFRKGRKRSYSLDSADSRDMEASFDEIQHEEERSKRIGEYEDYREELRNKKLLKKK